MTPQEQILDVFGALRATVSQQLLDRLRFIEPDYLEKEGSKIHRGRIVSRTRKSIFTPSWCFYEIGIGRYELDPPVPNCGGIGLVCFVNNKLCGGGSYASAVASIAGNFASGHRSFVASPRGAKNQGVSIYYPGFAFPIEAAAKDIRTLIEHTFDDLDVLTVKR